MEGPPAGRCAPRVDLLAAAAPDQHLVGLLDIHKLLALLHATDVRVVPAR